MRKYHFHNFRYQESVHSLAVVSQYLHVTPYAIFSLSSEHSENFCIAASPNQHTHWWKGILTQRLRFKFQHVMMYTLRRPEVAPPEVPPLASPQTWTCVIKMKLRFKPYSHMKKFSPILWLKYRSIILLITGLSSIQPEIQLVTIGTVARMFWVKTRLKSVQPFEIFGREFNRNFL